MDNGTLNFVPQLVMCRASLDDLPELVVPQGYELRSFRSGDVKVLCLRCRICRR